LSFLLRFLILSLAFFLAQRERFGFLLGHDDIAPGRAAFDERNRRTIELLEALATKHGAGILYPHERLCTDEVCRVISDGRPLYFDTDHLTITGAQMLRPMLEPAFKEMNR
jgi:lysophospholipase L1-like esterase